MHQDHRIGTAVTQPDGTARQPMHCNSAVGVNGPAKITEQVQLSGTNYYIYVLYCEYRFTSMTANCIP